MILINDLLPYRMHNYVYHPLVHNLCTHNFIGVGGGRLSHNALCPEMVSFLNLAQWLDRVSEFKSADLGFDPLVGQGEGQFCVCVCVPPSQLLCRLVCVCVSLRVNSCADLCVCVCPSESTLVQTCLCLTSLHMYGTHPDVCAC